MESRSSPPIAAPCPRRSVTRGPSCPCQRGSLRKPGSSRRPRKFAPWVEAIIRFWDDPVWYAEQSRRALGESQRWAPEKIEPPYVRFFESIGRGAG